MDEWVDELADFLHADGNSIKLTIKVHNFWVAVVKNGHGALISMNGWIWLIFCMLPVYKITNGGLVVIGYQCLPMPTNNLLIDD